MEQSLELIPPPTPAHMILLIAATLVMGAGVVGTGLLVRRAAREAWRVNLGRLLFGAGLTALAISSFPLLYPHQHHDTNWVNGSWHLNYPVDAALGALYWLLIVGGVCIWRRIVRSRRPTI